MWNSETRAQAKAAGLIVCATVLALATVHLLEAAGLIGREGATPMLTVIASFCLLLSLAVFAGLKRWSAGGISAEFADRLAGYADRAELAARVDVGPIRH